MSTTCPGCTKAIKVEDVVVKSYTPVNNLQTCGMIKITKRGRVAARRIQCGDGIICDGAIRRIRSGVSGASVTQTPIASYTALAIAPG